MTQEHPITPSPELVQQWLKERILLKSQPLAHIYLANRAAQWGADQELEACCEEFSLLWDRDEIVTLDDVLKHLRTVRRPKSPSLKEQALLAIDAAVADDRLSADVANIVRRALEHLSDQN
jgi:hypothetical protein